jgi:hypothetical protein
MRVGQEFEREIVWVNPSVPAIQQSRALGASKMECIKQAYTGGTRTEALSSGRLRGGGVRNVWHGATVKTGKEYQQAPDYNPELFEACMMANGWEPN